MSQAWKSDVKNDSPFVMDVILIQFDILEE